MIYLIDNLNDKIDDSLEKEFRDRKQYFRIIITLFLFVNIVVLTLLYKIKKENFKYEKELFEEKKKSRNNTLFYR